MIIFLLTIIVIELTSIVVWLIFNAGKINTYLTWNTRYEQGDYERTVTTPKLKLPTREATKSKQKGRSVTPVEDLVELTDLDFNTVVKAIEEIGQ